MEQSLKSRHPKRLALRYLSVADIEELAPLPCRSRYRPARSYDTSPGDAFHYDLPDFDSSAARARYFVNQMARAALAQIEGATADDKLFEYNGQPASLADLLNVVDPDPIAEIKSHL